MRIINEFTIRLGFAASFMALLAFDWGGASPQVTSFTPSVGWAGTTSSDGTLVKITGSGFDTDSTMNTVSFYPQVKAKVVDATPNESQYQFKLAFGGPGSGSGSLYNPTGLALDTAGKAYVVNVLAKTARLEVFDANGKYEREIGAADLHIPWGIALDKKGTLYVSEQTEKGKGQVAVFSNAGSLQGTLGVGTLVAPRGLTIDDQGNLYVADAGKPAVFKIAPSGTVLELKAKFQSPIAVAIDSQTKRLYVADQSADAIYVLVKDTYTETWAYTGSSNKCSELGVVDKNGQPLSCKPIAIAVDPGGDLIVAMDSGAQLFKLDSTGKLISKSIPAVFSSVGHVASPIAVMTDSKKRIYVVDKLCSCVKVFEPIDSQELLVYVPPGAKTGQITVQTSAGTGKSEQSFTVLAISEPPTVSKIEITQGVSSYPFVAGKETLIWARLKGIFGHPTRDKASISIQKPDGTTTNYRLGVDDFEYDSSNKETLAKSQLPHPLLDSEGDFSLNIDFSRDGKRLGSLTETKQVQKSKGISLLFVKFTDLADDQWSNKDPFPWFNLTAFLEGVDTLGRVFPVSPQKVTYRFHPGMYLDFIVDGVQNEEMCGAKKVDVQLRKILNEFRENSASKIDRAVALIDWSLNQTTVSGGGKVGGWSCGSCEHTQDTVNTFFSSGVGKYATWGSLAAHELGHSYGLIPSNQKNINPKDKTSCHSVNSTLQNEAGAPLEAWTAVSDQLLSDTQAYTIMGAYGASPPNDTAFFESKTAQGDELDYPYLARKFQNPGPQASQGKAEALIDKSCPEGTCRKLVMLGGIEEKGKALIEQSFLTTNDFPLTPVVESPYAVVFLNRAGRVVLREGFPLLKSIDQEISRPQGATMFSLVRPFPANATVVQIRRDNRILANLMLSEHNPVVTNIVVKVGEGQQISVRWKAVHPHPNELNYSVLYSADKGKSFISVGTGLKQTQYTWNASFAPGSEAAQVKVVAYDGLRQGSAVSEPFQITSKVPSASISKPGKGEAFTQGHSITLRGGAVDAEDGVLPGAQLTWWLDGTIELGKGESLRLKGTEHSSPNCGRLRMPVDLGRHTITLVAVDSDGNQTAAQSEFEVTADADRR